MPKTVCYELPEAKIQLIQLGKDRFKVVYFKHVVTELTYAQAAEELGECIMHYLACEGKLDNRMKGGN